MTASARSISTRTGRRLVLWMAIVALGAAVPVTFQAGPSGLQVDLAAAFAKSGKGKEGDGSDRDDDDDDDDDDKDDDDDRDDDDDDDKDDDDDRDEDRDDGRGGIGFSRTPDTRDDRGADGSWGAVVRVELTATGINVFYRDGSREILSNGTYRRIDSAGRVVESRTATGADLVRLRAKAGGRATTASPPDSAPAAPGQPSRIRLRGNDVIVEYTSGWTEMVERGRYRLTDRYGHVAVDRAATAADRSRLRALAGR